MPTIEIDIVEMYAVKMEARKKRKKRFIKKFGQRAYDTLSLTKHQKLGI